MKLLYTLPLIVTLLMPFNLKAASVSSPKTYANAITYYAPEVTDAIVAIKQLPESKEILEKIQKDGPISILFKPLPSVDFGAMWDADARTITVNSKSPRQLGNIICSILFEMHNAISNSQFMKLTEMASKGDISKDQYVEYVERMEHTNCLDTVKLLDKGMKIGIFPETSRWNIYANFDDHYKVQQLTEHSIWLSKNYDRMCKDSNKIGKVYQGTINGLMSLSQQDKRDMLLYLAIKNDLESSIQNRIDRASKKLQEEYATLEDCFKGNPNGKDCSRASQKTQMMDTVFKQNTIYASIVGADKNQHPG